jgi:hypothetical protein
MPIYTGASDLPTLRIEAVSVTRRDQDGLVIGLRRIPREGEADRTAI